MGDLISGDEALAQGSYDIVLVRLAPGENGVELVAKLRQGWPNSPSVVLTSHLEPEELRLVLATCAAGQAAAEGMTSEDLDHAIRVALGRTTPTPRATPHAVSRDVLDRRVGMLNSILQIVSQVHAEPTPEGAVDRALRATGALLGARVTLDAIVAGLGFDGLYDPFGDEALALDSVMVVPLAALHAEATGELRCERRERPFERGEEAAAVQVAHTVAVALEKHAAQAEAEDRARESEAVVAMVAHDLLAPVQTFLLGLDALRAGPTRGASASIVASLARTTDHMQLLIEDLLDVGRIHCGKLSLRPKSVPPARLLSAVVDQLGGQAAKMHLDLTWEAPTDPSEVVVDERRLRQALDNLVSNAIRHARGRVRLRVTMTDRAMRFHVMDDGAGVKEEDRAHLFERLHQGSATPEGELGLGLFIVDGIARAHGGRAGVDEAPGGGSDFWVEVPRLVHAAP